MPTDRAIKRARSRGLTCLIINPLTTIRFIACCRKCLAIGAHRRDMPVATEVVSPFSGRDSP